MRLLLTGDTHGDKWREKLDRLAARHTELTKNDLLVILGDTELVKNPGQMSKVEHVRLHAFMAYPWTTLILDGNHDNLSRLNSLPEIQAFGASVHVIHPGIYHLKRGESYTLNGIKVFTYGGAMSLKREMRTFGVDIWHEEVPCRLEFSNAQAKIIAAGETDCLLSHTCGNNIKHTLPCRLTEIEDPTSYQLDRLYDIARPASWFFGHFHLDWSSKTGQTNLYCCHNDIWEIDTTTKEVRLLLEHTSNPNQHNEQTQLWSE